ncbi:F-box domain-containing protein [Favolaschia claudopus]|uniref:F-box domain-containing protein n=1 Tax=Favolaschia claudopus TaxID=2862362 RepID=A0AAW0BI30_9AGAR
MDIEQASPIQMPFLLEPIPVEPSMVSKNLLGTNNLPAEHEFPALRDFVARGSARRAFLDSKISPLKVELEKLVEERDALDVEIRKHEGAISPLRHLPTEILSLIFTYAIQPGPGESFRYFAYYHFMDMKFGPLPLSAVCSRWRRIALSQSNLWTFFPLNFQEVLPESVPVEETLSAVKIHVERSRQAPLKLLFLPFYEHRLTELEQQVLDLLTPHIARWEEVDFHGTPQIYESLCTWSAEFLALRKLHISVDSQDEEVQLDIGNVFAFCPRLEEAFVNIESSDNTPVAFVPDTSSLRRYGAKNSWRYHVDVLRLARDLVDCVLRVTEPFDPFPTGDKISLPHLCRLAVSDVQPLHVLDTPALQELYCSEHTADLHDRLRELPRLRKLFVGEPRIPVDLQSFMHSVPALTALCMYLPMNYASTLFELLNSSPSRTTNQNQDVPNLLALHTLGLCFGPENSTTMGEPIDQDKLMRAVEARWHGGQLRSFRMYAMKFAPSESTLKCMEALRQDGMEFILENDSMDLYERMVPHGFCLYSDTYDLMERMLE